MSIESSKQILYNKLKKIALLLMPLTKTKNSKIYGVKIQCKDVN
jgi:hypothetical protein